MLDKDFQFITFDISILIENNEWGSYKYAEQEFLQALKKCNGAILPNMSGDEEECNRTTHLLNDMFDRILLTAD